jgi:hypothetical protein
VDEFVGFFSVLTAVAALGVAVWQVRRSALMSDRSNSLPIVAAMFSEARSNEFRAHLQRIYAETPAVVPDKGFEGMPESWRDSAYAVCYFYDYLGTLAAFGIVNEKLIIGTNATHVSRVWVTLQPFIKKERAWRRKSYPSISSPGFLRYFEHLAARITELGGREAAQRIQEEIKLRSLSD